MTTLTLHALDDAIAVPLRDYARRERKSLNQSVKDLLAVGLGLVRPKETDHRAEYESLSGILSDRDADEIRKNLRQFDRIDAEKWR